MAHSETLRENANQHVVKNKNSKIQESISESAVQRVLNTIKNLFPNSTFSHSKTLTNKQLTNFLIINGYNVVEKPLEKTYIKPDGGILYYEINGYIYPILITEDKKQGSNHILIQNTIKFYSELYGEDFFNNSNCRFLYNKKECNKLKILVKRKRLKHNPTNIWDENFVFQGKGNAIERALKNIMTFEIRLCFEKIFPYVIFATGDDLCEDSTIIDRLKSPFGFLLKLNTVNLFKIFIGDVSRGGSFFIKSNAAGSEKGFENWTEEEKYEIMLEIAIKSIKYYKEKYDK
jgi:hypothetical protein